MSGFEVYEPGFAQVAPLLAALIPAQRQSDDVPLSGPCVYLAERVTELSSAITDAKLALVSDKPLLALVILERTDGSPRVRRNNGGVA
jgi:hypothetical protein